MTKGFDLIFVLLVCFCFSCSESKNTPRQPHKVHIETQIHPQKTVHEPTSKVSCDALLSELKLKKDPAQDLFKLQSDMVFSEEDMRIWLADHRERLFLAECPRLQIQAPATDGFLIQAYFDRDDTKRRQENQISEAEWQRRTEVHLVETLSALKKNFLEARKNGNLRAARKWLDKWLDKDSQNTILKVIKGNLEFESQNYFGAIETYEAILRDQPDEPMVLHNLALSKKRIGSYDGAAALFLKLWNKAESDQKMTADERDEILLNLSDAYLLNNQPKEAKTFLDLVTDKTEFSYLLLQANYLRGAGSFSEARTILQQLVDEERADAAIYFNLVLVDLDLKDAQGAYQTYQVLRQIDEKMAKELAFIEILKKAPEETSGAKEPQ